MPTRRELLDAIVQNIRVLETDLDGRSSTCDHCGLNKKENWGEANAREQLRAWRAKVEKMKRMDWANAPERKHDDDGSEDPGKASG